MLNNAEINTHFNLSRIDKSIANNIKDIDLNFEGDAKMVFDFILFASQKLTINIFGYHRFSIKEFADFCGMNPADLCAKHPNIANGKEKAMVINGHKFESVLDYTLLRMLNRNIIFSRRTYYKDNGDTLKLENFSILKGINLHSGSVKGTKKVYEVRLSDDIIEGFLQRYYTLDTSRLSIIGKGKGGHSRKKIYVWLNKMFHIYFSKKICELTYSVDYLAELAGVMYMKEVDKDGHQVEKLPKHKKEAVNNILKSILKNMEYNGRKLHFSFEYSFVNSNSGNKYEEDYFVKFDFKNNMNLDTENRLAFEHKIKYALIKDLNAMFNTLYPPNTLIKLEQEHTSMENERDHFQRWLNNPKADLEKKKSLLQSAYAKAYHFDKNKQLKDTEAISIIHNGFLANRPLEYID